MAHLKIDDDLPTVLVVMGVSGSGKTTVGALLAGRLGWEYAEADDFHTPEAIAKMNSGVPLDDDDRWPWLRSIAGWIDERLAAGDPGVVTCSALKRAYRDVLPLDRPGVRLVYLEGDRELIGSRVAARQGHFFAADMLDSQFRTLEPPAPDENPLTVPISGSPDDIVRSIIEGLSRPGG